MCMLHVHVHVHVLVPHLAHVVWEVGGLEVGLHVHARPVCERGAACGAAAQRTYTQPMRSIANVEEDVWVQMWAVDEHAGISTEALAAHVHV